MRQDQCEVEIRDHDWIDTDDQPVQPTLSITSRAPEADFRDRMTDRDNTILAATEIDVAFRYQSAVDDADAIGVLGVTHRTTGAYILEAPTEEDLIQTVIKAATRYAERTATGRYYTLEFWTARGLFASYEKQTFLVYAQDGTLLRHRSLIPTGVEI